MNANDLTGVDLDAAVSAARRDLFAPVAYSREWQFGGPIIAEQRIALRCLGWDEAASQIWRATITRGTTIEAEGQSPLVAAMRAYVLMTTLAL